MTESWTLFMILFPFSYGFMVGFAFMLHLYISWRYIPGKEGLLTGIINAGFGAGGAIFTALSTAIINPDQMNVNPDKNQKPFPPEVANNLPKCL